MARISLLQLDTHFPRIPGDVGCPETYQCELEIIRIPNATVSNIVTDQPSQIELRPFLDAISKARGEVITTSCGFLAPLQSELEKHCDVPFIASSLIQLPELCKTLSPEEISILTFDANKLGEAHLPQDCAVYARSIFGLEPSSHLRDVISNDQLNLDEAIASQDVCRVFQASERKETKAILLECTNFPPYKNSLRSLRDIPIYDILTAIETRLPNAINPSFL